MSTVYAFLASHRENFSDSSESYEVSFFLFFSENRQRRRHTFNRSVFIRGILNAKMLSILASTLKIHATTIGAVQVNVSRSRNDRLASERPRFQENNACPHSRIFLSTVEFLHFLIIHSARTIASCIVLELLIPKLIFRFFLSSSHRYFNSRFPRSITVIYFLIL